MMQDCFSENSRCDWKARDSICVFGIFALFCAAAIGFFQLRPDSTITEGFYFRDEGFVLSVAEVLLNGGKLYEDAFWQYGPIPIAYYLQYAKIFGNSAFVYLASLVPVFALCCSLSYAILRRSFGFRFAVLSVSATIAPVFLHAALGPRIYMPFEITSLLLLALIYGKPSQRTWAWSLAIGVVLGTMQWIKFGGAFVAGAAVAIADIVSLYRAGFTRELMRKLFVGYPIILAAFLLCEAVRVLHLFFFLEPEYISEVFFPSYMLVSYASFEGGLSFESWGYLFGKQIPGFWMLGTLSFACFFLLWNRGERKLASSIESFPGFVLYFFYLVGMIVYFKHKWLFYQYVWVLLVPFIGVVGVLPARLRFVALLAVVPMVLIVPYKFFLQGFDRSPMQMRNGETLWLDPRSMVHVQAVIGAVEQRIPANGKVVFFGHGSGGFYHFGDFATVTRHRWFIPGFVQDFERAEVLREVLTADAIVVQGPLVATMDPDRPESWKLEDRRIPFTAEEMQLLRERLETPEIVEENWAIFSVSR